MPHDELSSEKTSFLFFLRNQLPATSNFERLRYHAEDRRYMLGNLAVGAKITAVLFLLFSLVDYVVYPEFFFLFLSLRVACALLLVSLVGLSKQRWAKNKYRAFASSIPLISACFLEAMVFLGGRPESPYYAGITLCIVGTGTLYQWSSKAAALTSLVIIGIYLIPGLFQISSIDSTSLGVFGMNCLFMIATAVLVIIGTFYHYSFRWKEFIARSNLKRDQAALLELKNEKIAQTAETLRQTETQLFQAEKMSLLGQLSSGVIHEVANPVNITNQALDVLRRQVKRKHNDENLVEIIDDMQAGLDRIRDIVSELRGFAQGSKAGSERVLVNEAVESSLRLLNKSIAEVDAEISVEIDETLEIEAVKNQIVQVFTNLLHNSIQALGAEDRKGKLIVTAQRIAGDFVELVIWDNGAGIAPEDLDSVFDPFFTTKDPGVGTGLGLSICYRIITNHGGEIKVASPPEGGTRFEIRLPVEQPADIG